MKKNNGRYLPNVNKQVSNSEVGFSLTTAINKGGLTYKNDDFTFKFADSTEVNVRSLGSANPLTTLQGNIFNGNEQLTKTNISGQLPESVLPTTTTVQGNTFNDADQLLQLDSNGEVPSANLPTTVTLQGNTFNGSNQLVKLSASGQLQSNLVGTQIDGNNNLAANMPFGVSQGTNNIRIGYGTSIYDATCDRAVLLGSGAFAYTNGTLARAASTGVEDVYMQEYTWFLRARSIGSVTSALLSIGENPYIGPNYSFVGEIDYSALGDTSSTYFREKRLIMVSDDTIVQNVILPEYSASAGTGTISLNITCSAGIVSVTAIGSGIPASQRLHHTAILTGMSRDNAYI